MPAYGGILEDVSHENVELIRSLQPDGADLVEVFGSEEQEPRLPPALATTNAFADDLVVQFIPGEEGVYIPEYRGVDGLFEGWRDWLAPWKSYRIRVQELIDRDDDVVALVHLDGTTRHGDVAMSHDPAAVWTMRDGKIAMVRFFLDRGQALRETAEAQAQERP